MHLQQHHRLLRRARFCSAWPERPIKAMVGRFELRRVKAVQRITRCIGPQLNRRYGPLTKATTERIQALPLATLEALAEALLDFSGPADLAAWMEDHKG